MKRLALLLIAVATLAVPSSATAANPPTSGLEGKLLLPRDVAAALKPYWSNYELTKGIATVLSESAGYIGAFHLNLDSDGNVVSKDCGLFQISILARFIGTPVEDHLRTVSLDPADYLPVLANNVGAAFDLYNQPWTRDGQPDIRRWQPWVGYTSGWATYPGWFIWHQENGLPTGPWVKTGRYIQRAIVGQMNRHIVTVGDWTADTALHWARRYAMHFGVDPGLLYVSARGTVAFHAPPVPTAPPPDGVGPRPAANNGL